MTRAQQADVWSCGVLLYTMLFGSYPFEDPSDQRNYAKTIQRISAVQYAFPPGVAVSPACTDLLVRIFVADPTQRLTIGQIRQHPWFLQNLPRELLVSPPPHPCPLNVDESMLFRGGLLPWPVHPLP